MSKELKIETRVRRLGAYIEDMERGLLQIPPFQRDKVWDNKKRKDLWDSLKNGYPIGSILLWQPKEDIFGKSLDKVGPYTIEIDGVQNFWYILDGFQRLSTIFGCLIDPDKTQLQIDKAEWRKEFFICYDLEKQEFFIPRTDKLETYQVPLYKLIDTRAAFKLFRDLEKEMYPEKTIELYRDRYEILGSSLMEYFLPSTEIKGGGVDEAVQIFSRVNSTGSVISPDWMVSALSYNKDSEGFRLGTVIDDLIAELKAFNFDALKRELILQCIMNSFDKVHFDQMTKGKTTKIEALVKRDDFVEKTHQTIQSIKKAVRFLYEELLVVDAKLIPYNNQLIFITDFFNQLENPTDSQKEQLKDWFWKTTYANYFTIYALSKQREAYYRFQKFLKGEINDPLYNDNPDLPFRAAAFPDKIFYGSVRAKALVLFMLNHANKFEPIKADDVEGMELNHLFFDVKNEKKDYYPEGAVVTINKELTSKFHKSRDLTFMLQDYKEDYIKYLITPEMSEIYHKKESNYQQTILEIRKNLITEKEKEFVKKLGIDY